MDHRSESGVFTERNRNLSRNSCSLMQLFNLSITLGWFIQNGAKNKQKKHPVSRGSAGWSSSLMRDQRRMTGQV